MGGQQSSQVVAQTASPTSSLDASAIQSLDYSNHKLKSLQDVKLQEAYFKYIFTLNLNSNELENIVGISKVANVEELDLSSNPLKILQDELYTLSKLRKLKLSNCKLVGMSSKISNLQSLVELDVSQNSLQALPLELKLLDNLTIINASENEITNFTRELAECRKLVTLILNKNNINYLPKEISSLKSLVLLNLSDNFIKEIPKEIEGLENIKKLYLDQNELLELPPEIGKLVTLREFNVRGNQLSELPKEMAKLTKLQLVDIDGNDFTRSFNTEDIHEFLEQIASTKSSGNATMKRLRKHRTRLSMTDAEATKMMTKANQDTSRDFLVVEYKKRLYRLKGHDRILVRYVDVSHTSLNHGDVFILDNGKKFFLWMGLQSNAREKKKGNFLAHKLNEEQGGFSPIVSMEDGKEKKADLEEFWRALGSRGTIGPAIKNSDIEYEKSQILSTKLFRVSDASGRIEISAWVGQALTKDMLDSSACYVLDCDSMVFVWAGMYSSMSERSWALLKAEELVSHGSRAACTDIIWVVDADEMLLFRDQFIDWEDLSWDVQEVEMKKKGSSVDLATLETTSLAPEKTLNLIPSGRVSTKSLDPFKNHGYLEEKTTHMWKQFYFVLREGSLYKYATEAEFTSNSKAIEEVELEDCNFGEYEPDTQPLCFEITFGRSGRQIILRAETIESVYSWLNNLLKHKFIKESEVESQMAAAAAAKVEPKKVEQKKVEEKPNQQQEDLSGSGSFATDEAKKKREKLAQERKEKQRLAREEKERQEQEEWEAKIREEEEKLRQLQLKKQASFEEPKKPAEVKKTEPVKQEIKKPEVVKPKEEKKPEVKPVTTVPEKKPEPVKPVKEEKKPEVKPVTTVPEKKPEIVVPAIEIKKPEPVKETPKKEEPKPVVKETKPEEKSVLPDHEEKRELLGGVSKAAVPTGRKAASKNPIRERQEKAKQEEEARKIREQQEKESGKTNSIQVASQRQAQLGGYGLLYALGANPPDLHLFKKSSSEKKAPTMSEANDVRLIQIKGRRKCFSRLVELNTSSLNSGDVFLLDTGKATNIIFQWNGAEANRIEKGKAMDVAKSIKDKERSGTSRVVVLEEGKVEDEQFWSYFAGKGSRDKIPSAEEAGDDLVVEKAIWERIKLFQIQEGEGRLELLEVGSSRLLREMIQENECYILDAVTEMYVWTGKKATAAMKNGTLKLAKDLLAERDFWTAPLSRELPGAESVLFKEKFADWGSGPPIQMQQVKSGVNTAPAQKQEKIDVTKMFNILPEREEVMIDDGSGSIKIWRIEEFKKVEIDKSTYGEFFSSESYVILYTYIWKNKDCHIIYFWQGRSSSIQEKGASALLTIELDDQLKGMAKEIRVTQNKEPKHFISIFKGKFIIHLGKEKAADASSTSLYQIQKRNSWNIKAIQIPVDARQLNTNSSFVLKTGKGISIWNGKNSTKEEKDYSNMVANLNNGGAKISTFEEGKESSEFWTLIGGKKTYPLCQLPQRLKPRLFECSIGTGIIKVDEIVDFAQDDLMSEDVFILDAFYAIYVWIGKRADEKEKITAMETAAEYLREIKDSRVKDESKIYSLHEGTEPIVFTCHFHGWDTTKLAKKIQDYDDGLYSVAQALKELNRTYSYDDLLNKRYPKGLDTSKLETYLSADEFQQVLGATMDEFTAWPLWKKQKVKRELGLF